MSDATVPPTCPSPTHRAVSLALPGCSLNTHEWLGGNEAQVLLLHGLGGNAITWHAVAPVLAAALRARVLAVDLPGFGASRPGARSTTIDALTELVQEVLQRSDPGQQRWHLAGNSLGGLLALRAAGRMPTSCASVTLASVALPLSWGRGTRELGALLPYVPAALPHLGRRLFVRYVNRRGLPGVVDDPVAALFHDPAAMPADIYERLLAVSEYRFGWTEEAARAYEQATLSLGLQLLVTRNPQHWMNEVSCPVHSIYGSCDPLYPPAAWRRLEAAQPNWHHTPLPNVGHVPQLEAPGEFAEHMLQFIARTSPLRR